ncbi:MAG TPA: OB-fold domain-containing protein [Trebonia sp.]|jgi:hypothetical protein
MNAILEAAEKVKAAGESSPRAGRDPVNLPLIRNWIEAIGDDNPAYTADGGVAPPAMMQAWTMPGLHGARGDDDPLSVMTEVLDNAGYPSVVATNCDQVYLRYLRHGERLTVRASLVDVTGPKKTGLGEGWFVTTRSTWYSGDEPVATMDFRILKFRPAEGPPSPRAKGRAAAITEERQARNERRSDEGMRRVRAPGGERDNTVMRPQVTRDSAFFWEGTRVGELRIAQCGNCGALRHPPGPMCPRCGTGSDGGYVVASGAGTIYSYVVHRHPPVPGKTLPMVIALVDLPEASQSGHIRIMGEMPGVKADDVTIGMPVRVAFDRIDDDLTLPAWKLAPAGEALPEFVLKASATFIVSSALATRDFQDVHHDRDLAVAKGSKDIFVNILTSTGLVQRFVAGWAGQDAVFKSIRIRLGAPCYAGDTLTFTGNAVPVTDDTSGGPDEWEVTVRGDCSLGAHVTGKVRVTRPGRNS